MLAQTSLFQTLADPTRLAILEALRDGERSVGYIVARVPIQQSGVSRHLRILHDAGLVRVRPDGQRRLYAIRPEPLMDLDAWLEGYRRLWIGRLDRLEAALLARQQLPVEPAEPSPPEPESST